jgi:hypothetical protein
MKIIGKRLVETLMASILLAVTLPFSAAARITSPELDPASASRQSKKIPTASSLISIYTDFAKQCRTLEEPTEHNLTLLRRCPGVAGYKFLLEWDDDALTITMVNPIGKKFDLGLSEMFTDVKPYADLRAKAEWRVKREHGTVVPVALIVRVDPMNDMSTRDRPFLAVAKITKQEICMTDKITPGANENAEARRAADIAATRPCLKAIE